MADFGMSVHVDATLDEALERTRTALRDVLTRLVEQGAEAIVLGCTELELLLTPEDCTVPLLPTARLHVDAAIELALA